MSIPTANKGYIKADEGEQYDVDVTNNNLDAIDRDIKETDKLAKGLIFQKHVASSTGMLLDGIAENIPTITFKANRRYRIVWDFSYYMGGNADSLFYVSIVKAPVGDAAASISNLVVLEGRTKFVQTFLGSATSHTGPIISYHIQGAADETTQVKFRVQRVYGDDGMWIVGNANERAIYSVYDDGLADGSSFS